MVAGMSSECLSGPMFRARRQRYCPNTYPEQRKDNTKNEYNGNNMRASSESIIDGLPAEISPVVVVLGLFMRS